MNKHRLLLSYMAAGYHNGQGVDTMTLCKITPAYSQRFGEWRKEGIRVDKIKNDDGHTYIYRLRTDPDTFDWDTLRPIIPHQRIRRGRRKVEKAPEQESLTL